jgi:hypothetical protein
MTQNHKRTANKCKRFVNFSKNIAFLANYLAIYMNPHKAVIKNKTKENQNGNGKAL